METCLTAANDATTTIMEEERSLEDGDGNNRASSVHTSTDDASQSLSSIVIATAMDKHDKGQVRGIQKPIARVFEVKEY